jgi:hypothetical protein
MNSEPAVAEGSGCRIGVALNGLGVWSYARFVLVLRLLDLILHLSLRFRPDRGSRCWSLDRGVLLWRVGFFCFIAVPGYAAIWVVDPVDEASEAVNMASSTIL